MGGKGRAPCCDKSQVKRGPWSPSEDLRLISFIQKHGHDNWRALPKQAGLVRCGKSCRLRWINYLRPDLKRGNFTKEEEDSIIKLHEAWGNKWSKIASQFPGRTDNEIKNVWNTHLRKRLVSKNSCGDDQSKELSSITSTSSTSSSSASFQLSSGNPSVEAGVEFEHQSGHESSMANKNPYEHELPNLTTFQEKIDQYSPMEVTNQVRAGDAKASKALTISSSFSSHDSSKGSSSSQGGISEPDNSLFDFTGAYETQIADKAEFEIPFESDGDFWNMLDGLVPFQPNHELLQEDDQANQSSNLGLVESGKWLSYLESELGLEQTTKTQINDQDFLMKDATEKLVPENYSDKLPQPAEIDQGMDDYFEMWPASFARQFCHLN